MTHKEVYKYFTLYFPQFAEHVKEWFPNGKSSVRVRQTNGQVFVFTYYNPKNWSFETVDHFAERLRGRTKM